MKSLVQLRVFVCLWSEGSRTGPAQWQTCADLALSRLGLWEKYGSVELPVPMNPSCVSQAGKRSTPQPTASINQRHRPPNHMWLSPSSVPVVCVCESWKHSPFVCFRLHISSWLPGSQCHYYSGESDGRVFRCCLFIYIFLQCFYRVAETVTVSVCYFLLLVELVDGVVCYIARHS